MMIALLALALQAAQPSPMLDPAFTAADDAWLRCRDTRLSLEAMAGRGGKRAVANVFAGCAAEEAAVRAHLVAALGNVEGERTMARIRTFSGKMMMARLRRIAR